LFTIGNPGNVGRSRPDKIAGAATEMFGDVFLKARQYAHGGGGAFRDRNNIIGRKIYCLATKNPQTHFYFGNKIPKRIFISQKSQSPPKFFPPKLDFNQKI
jgi:hypothetical protein